MAGRTIGTQAGYTTFFLGLVKECEKLRNNLSNVNSNFDSLLTHRVNELQGEGYNVIRRQIDRKFRADLVSLIKVCNQLSATFRQEPGKYQLSVSYPGRIDYSQIERTQAELNNVVQQISQIDSNLATARRNRNIALASLAIPVLGFPTGAVAAAHFATQITSLNNRRNQASVLHEELREDLRRMKELRAFDLANPFAAQIAALMGLKKRVTGNVAGMTLNNTGSGQIATTNFAPITTSAAGGVAVSGGSTASGRAASVSTPTNNPEASTPQAPTRPDIPEDSGVVSVNPPSRDPENEYIPDNQFDYAEPEYGTTEVGDPNQGPEWEYQTPGGDWNTVSPDGPSNDVNFEVGNDETVDNNLDVNFGTPETGSTNDINFETGNNETVDSNLDVNFGTGEMNTTEVGALGTGETSMPNAANINISGGTANNVTNNTNISNDLGVNPATSVNTSLDN